MQNYIIIIGIVELLAFSIIIYFIIRAIIFINMLNQEITELNSCLPEVIRDIRADLRSFNAELSEYVSAELISPQKIGFVTGQIFTEIIMLRFKTFKLGKKFVVLSMILKTLNTGKLLKPLLSYKTVR